MIVLSAKNLGKSYGVDVILEGVSFNINSGDRIGILGPNGAGKSTLLNLISGDLERDSGEVFLSAGKKLGYLRQQNHFEEGKTVYQVAEAVFDDVKMLEKQADYLAGEIGKLGEKSDLLKEYEGLINDYNKVMERFEAAGGPSYKSKLKGILKSMGLGREYYESLANDLSGGEKTRLALACLLLENPDVLLMDEPTNHLDLPTLTWLEDYLKSYKGTLLIVSHDRYFLSKVCNGIFLVENHHLHSYVGSYQSFLEQRKIELETQERAYERQQREIKRQEDMIRRFKERGTEKLAKRAASREKMLSKMDKTQRPKAHRGSIKLSFKQDLESGKDVLKAEELGKAFFVCGKKRQLFSHVNLDIKKGERICIVGDNGIGKTTLLKMILGREPITEGFIEHGYNVEIGYYDQAQQLLDDNKTLFDEIHDEHPLLKDGQVRGYLGKLMFQNDQVYNKISSLSGGERGRLALLKLMLSGANLLIMDEPTNHLDIESKEVFENALMEFEGTVVIVSHDRYFLNKVPNRILELRASGIREYLGKYDYYIEKKGEEENNSPKRYGFTLEGEGANGQASFGGDVTKPWPPDSSSVGDGQKQLTSREERALKKQAEGKIRKLARQKKSLESEIAKKEGEIAGLEARLLDQTIAQDHVQLGEISQKLAEAKEDLDRTYDEWLGICEELGED